MGDNLLLGLGTKFQNPFIIIISYLKFQCCHGNFFYSVKNVIHVKNVSDFIYKQKLPPMILIADLLVMHMKLKNNNDFTCILSNKIK